MFQSDPLAGKYIVRPNGCWEWQRYRMPKGYGQACYQGRLWMAHRLSYTLYVGKIPDGYQVHHKCHNTRCINPAHLEALSEPVHAHANKTIITRCPNGHPYTAANTIVNARGQRSCRTCQNNHMREKRQNRKES